ncbi:hypothetical protein MY11210_005929 [Beauveria gryllotalpidicola]
MEAASARAAARDRWGEYGGRTPSQLERYIQSACSPDNYEPNLALNLEISDLVNQKKGAAPREAATAIVNFVNHRNPNVALLALALLDICVKNCGYPFHLQISTKEFLNELVRRFPERPPLRATRVQAKILEAIEEWRITICDTSRYKDDLGFIRDMHRLLSYKGYMFPEIRREDAAVLNPSDNLKSAEEMEEEDREAQSAKLQELIRRGTPADLQEANRLMKIMAGYDTRSKTDYRAKAAEDVSRIQAKARLLEERLEAFRPGDKMTDGDVFSELASALQSAHPKIQKMCEEESDDHEAVAKLLDINDSIHRTVERYKLMKKGDLEGAAKVAAGGPAPSQTATVAAGPAGELSLIDFDADAAEANCGRAAQPRGTATQGIENDLLGLDIGGSSSNFGQGGSIALGFGANQNIPGPALLSSLTDNSTASTNNTTMPASSSNLSNQFMSFASPSASQSTTPNPTAPAIAAPPPPPASDPFAALMSRSSSSSAAGKQPAAAEDDEWNFSSALPESSATQQQLPCEHRGIITDGSIRAEFLANRATASSPAIDMVFSFSNNTAQPVSELHFQLAVTKGYELKLKPQTGRDLAPKQSKGITQHVAVHHAGGSASSQRVDSAKLRWRAAYKVGGEQKAETGEISEFSIA